MLDAARYETIAITIDSDGIALLELNRPDRLNAVSTLMHTELSRVFADAEADERVKVIVLTGRGRAFSAGGDTSPERTLGGAFDASVMAEARRIIESLIDLRKPLIGAINGHAIGLGATIASLCDVSFMSSNGRFGDPHVRAALPAGNGSAVIWPLLIGVNQAKRLLLTGVLVTAEEACRLGLITEVTPAEETPGRAMGLARELAALAPHALQGTKASVNQLLKAACDLVLPFGLAIEEEAMQRPEYHAAMRALAEKR